MNGLPGHSHKLDGRSSSRRRVAANACALYMANTDRSISPPRAGTAVRTHRMMSTTLCSGSHPSGASSGSSRLPFITPPVPGRSTGCSRRTMGGTAGYSGGTTNMTSSAASVLNRSAHIASCDASGSASSSSLMRAVKVGPSGRSSTALLTSNSRPPPSCAASSTRSRCSVAASMVADFGAVVGWIRGGSEAEHQQYGGKKDGNCAHPRWKMTTHPPLLYPVV